MLKSLHSNTKDGCHHGHLEIHRTTSPPQEQCSITLKQLGMINMQNCKISGNQIRSNAKKAIKVQSSIL